MLDHTCVFRWLGRAESRDAEVRVLPIKVTRVQVRRPAISSRCTCRLGGVPRSSGFGSTNSASTIRWLSCPPTKPPGVGFRSHVAHRRPAHRTVGRLSSCARSDPSKTKSNGRDPTSTLTALRALNPARSRASLIAASLTASEMFVSTAMPSSYRGPSGRLRLQCVGALGFRLTAAVRPHLTSLALRVRR